MVTAGASPAVGDLNCPIIDDVRHLCVKLRDVLIPAEASQRYLQHIDPRAYSMLRTSVVPTMLTAGVGVSVIPSQAEATLDIRPLPDPP